MMYLYVYSDIQVYSVDIKWVDLYGKDSSIAIAVRSSIMVIRPVKYVYIALMVVLYNNKEKSKSRAHDWRWDRTWSGIYALCHLHRYNIQRYRKLPFLLSKPKVPCAHNPPIFKLLWELIFLLLFSKYHRKKTCQTYKNQGVTKKFMFTVQRHAPHVSTATKRAHYGIVHQQILIDLYMNWSIY